MASKVVVPIRDRLIGLVMSRPILVEGLTAMNIDALGRSRTSVDFPAESTDPYKNVCEIPYRTLRYFGRYFYMDLRAGSNLYYNLIADDQLS